MYHSRWKGNHYQAGFRYGSMLFKNHINPLKDFEKSQERVYFTKQCIPLYQKYYPEILQEIKGISDGLHINWEDMAVFLFSMYCFLFENKCSCFAFQNNGKTILAKNSDFLISIEKICDSPYYKLDGVYSFIGNTTAWTEIEDGMNECGVAVGLTFVYPTCIKPGFNAGMLVRYILEKCQTIQQAIQALQTLPIASAQNIILADKKEIALVECNCKNVKVIIPQDKKVFTTNHFVSPEMSCYQYQGEDDCYSHERYQTLLSAFQNIPSLSFAMDLLSGKKGFLCQYDRKKGMDTIWSVVYDVSENSIYRVEGNPSRKTFKKDKRL